MPINQIIHIFSALLEMVLFYSSHSGSPFKNLYFFIHYVYSDSLISWNNLLGVIGKSFTLTLNGLSASTTALAIAAGAEIAPLSPTPLTPIGFLSEKNS